MPRLNGTGPQGAGPQTGKGMGNCSAEKPTVPFYGRNGRIGMGCGRGSKYGRQNRLIGYFQAQEMTAEEQKQMLENRKSFLENQISDINQHIENL